MTIEYASLEKLEVWTDEQVEAFVKARIDVVVRILDDYRHVQDLSSTQIAEYILDAVDNHNHIALESSIMDTKITHGGGKA